MITVIPTHLAASTWDAGASDLALAMDRNNDEMTPDQMKMLLIRGELLLLRGESLWAVVQPITYPNKRVLHIHAVVGSGISQEVIRAVYDLGFGMGCSGITCSAWGAAERLYRRFGFEPVYTTLEFKPEETR